jgi:hypothetical protein
LIGLLQSAPVNIPGSSLGNFSPTSHHQHSNLFSVADPFGAHTSGGHTNSGTSAPKMNNSFSHTDSLFFQSHLISPGMGGNNGVGGGDGGLSLSPDIRISELNSLNSDLTNSTTNNLFDNHLQQQTKHHPFSISPLVNHTNHHHTISSEIGRLRDELANKNAQMINWEEQVIQASKVCEAWKSEMEEGNRKVSIDCEEKKMEIEKKLN